MAKVYVVCEPTQDVAGVPKKSVDLTPAMLFGDLEVLLPHSQSMLAPVPTVRSLNTKLDDFTDEDFILPIGDPVLISTVAMVAASKNSGRVKFLKWDKRVRRYFQIQVDLSGKAIQ